MNYKRGTKNYAGLPILAFLVYGSSFIVHSSLFIVLYGSSFASDPEGISFLFKKRDIHLRHQMRRAGGFYHPREGLSDQSLDTLSNWFDPTTNRVEIIRQDYPTRPTLGLALTFEFDEENGEYPYTPASAALQIKDFSWGGMEFSLLDTMNYTGISNDVSDDLAIEILGFQNDTISGRFSGLLLSGAGTMASVEDGRFRVRVYRVH